MRDRFPVAMIFVAALLLASMLIRCVVAAYRPHSPEVASAHILVVASSANARTLAPAAEAGRSTLNKLKAPHTATSGARAATQ